MNKIILSFLITGIAGISTVIGTFPIFLKYKNKNKIINIALAFSSGVMFCTSIFSLIPESFIYFYKNYNYKSYFLVLIFILIGIFICYLINNLFHKENNTLYKIGIVSMIALIMHNIPEGILTFSTSSINIYLGMSLALAILFHNIPEGISISVPIYYSTKSRKKAFVYTFISGFSEIFGALLTYIFLYKYINYNFISCILSITAGIMIYVSLFELFKESIKYNKKRTYIFFIIGLIFMLMITKLA